MERYSDGEKEWRNEELQNVDKEKAKIKIVNWFFNICTLYRMSVFYSVGMKHKKWICIITYKQKNEQTCYFRGKIVII